MSIEWIVTEIVIIVGFAALYIFLKTFIKSTVEYSIAHEFEIKLETFKQEFARDLHSIDRKDKYQLAALDQKLEAHQKAYALARKMATTVHSADDVKNDFQKEFITFWDTYCLYLEESVRNHFWVSVNLYWDYKMYLYIWKKDNTKEDAERLKSSFNHIISTQEIIASAVNLTAMVDEALKIDNTKNITEYGIEETKKK
jgi:hypothetical protein